MSQLRKMIMLTESQYHALKTRANEQSCCFKSTAEHTDATTAEHAAGSAATAAAARTAAEPAAAAAEV